MRRQRFLLPHTIRATRLVGLPASAALVALILTRTSLDSSIDRLIAAAVMASGASAVLADPAAPVLAASPTTLRRRSGHRLLVVVAILVGLWIGVQRLAIPGAATVPPRWGWCLLAALVGFVVAVEAAANRWAVSTGVLGPPMLALAFFAAVRVPSRFTVVPAGGPVPAGRLLLVAAVLAMALHRLLRDRCAARRRRRSVAALGCSALAGRTR